MAKHRETIVRQYLERVPLIHLQEHGRIIGDMLGAGRGIYILYRKGGPYYIGLTKRVHQRLKEHLHDQHQGKWDHFSVYLVVARQSLGEVEALLLRTMWPRGNPHIEKLRRAEDLSPDLCGRLELAGCAHRVRAPLRLEMDWGENKHCARLRGNGTITYGKRKFNSPHEAAEYVTGRRVNGWQAWTYKDESGKQVPLARLRT